LGCLSGRQAGPAAPAAAAAAAALGSVEDRRQRIRVWSEARSFVLDPNARQVSPCSTQCQQRMQSIPQICATPTSGILQNHHVRHASLRTRCHQVQHATRCHMITPQSLASCLRLFLGMACWAPLVWLVGDRGGG
jgi:hypothetical protein